MRKSIQQLDGLLSFRKVAQNIESELGPAGDATMAQKPVPSAISKDAKPPFLDTKVCRVLFGWCPYCLHRAGSDGAQDAGMMPVVPVWAVSMVPVRCPRCLSNFQGYGLGAQAN